MTSSRKVGTAQCPGPIRALVQGSWVCLPPSLPSKFSTPGGCTQKKCPSCFTFLKIGTVWHVRLSPMGGWGCGGFSVLRMRTEETHHPHREPQWGRIPENRSGIRLGRRTIKSNRLGLRGLNARGVFWGIGQTRGQTFGVSLGTYEGQIVARSPQPGVSYHAVVGDTGLVVAVGLWGMSKRSPCVTGAAVSHVHERMRARKSRGASMLPGDVLNYGEVGLL